MSLLRSGFFAVGDLRQQIIALAWCRRCRNCRLRACGSSRRENAACAPFIAARGELIAALASARWPLPMDTPLKAFDRFRPAVIRFGLGAEIIFEVFPGVAALVFVPSAPLGS